MEKNINNQVLEIKNEILDEIIKEESKKPKCNGDCVDCPYWDMEFGNNTYKE
jgi:hypothetical protein